eukprot:235581_1
MGKTEKNMNIQMRSVPSKEVNDNDGNNTIQNKPQYDVIIAGEDDIIDMDENHIFTPDTVNSHTKYLSAAQKRELELYPTPNDNENNKYNYLSEAQKKELYVTPNDNELYVTPNDNDDIKLYRIEDNNMGNSTRNDKYKYMLHKKVIILVIIINI